MKVQTRFFAWGVAVLVALGLCVAFIAHPPVNSGDWASWVQAIGSIAAILASGAIASLQIRATRQDAQRARQTKVLVIAENVVVIAKAICSQLASMDAKLKSAHGEIRDYLRSVQPQELFLPEERSVQALPLHDVDDAEVVKLVIDLLNLIRNMRYAMERLSKAARASQVWSSILTNSGLGSELIAAQNLLKRCQVACDKANMLRAQ